MDKSTREDIVLEDGFSMYGKLASQNHGKIHMGKHTKIGSGSTIQCVDSVTIGENAVIGAGSVVTHDITPHTTFAGCPARQISEKTNNHWHFFDVKNI